MIDLWEAEKNSLKYRVYSIDRDNPEYENSFVRMVICYTAIKEVANEIVELLSDSYNEEFGYEEI